MAPIKSKDPFSYIIWNIMEQTFDCLHCGDRFDISNRVVYESVEILEFWSKFFNNQHSDCEQTEKGKALEEFNEWYRNESMVTFEATPEQVYELVKSVRPDISDEKFQSEFKSLYMTFKSFEIHRLEDENKYYIFRQMWRTNNRADLWDAIKSVGATMLCERIFEAMPKELEQYKFHKPIIRYRHPVRVWGARSYE